MTDSMRITPSGQKKLSAETYKKCISECVKNLTLKAEALCIEEAPAGPTGNLRRGHKHKISTYTGKVRNTEPYVHWIVWGGKDGRSYPKGNIYYFKGKPFTSKGIPNNYPQRVSKALVSEKYASRFLKDALKKEGVL